MARILVVDDDEDAVDLFSAVLRDAGHVVYGAQDGEEALRLVSLVEPDVVVLDIFMPRKDGLETLLALRHGAPSVKVVMVSAGWTAPVVPGRRPRYLDFISTAIQLGANAALAKPIEPEDLVDTVARLMAA